MDVARFSDEELASMLTERGFTPGPILDSTRRVYQKKLQRMLDEGVHAEGAYSLNADLDEREYSSVDEDDDYDPQNADTQPIEQLLGSQQQHYTARSSPPRPQREQQHYSSSYQTTSSSSSRVTSSVGGDSYLTRRSLRGEAFDPSRLVSQAQPPKATQQQPKKRGLSRCVILLFVLVVGVVGFLVYQNMESVSHALPPASVDE